MNWQHGWRRKTLQEMEAADGARVHTAGRRALVRVILLAMCLALVGQGTAQQAGAMDTDSHGAALANAIVCVSAGGDAEVIDYGEGDWRVNCNGGMLDGWGCYHSDSSEVGTWWCTPKYTPPPGKGTPIDLGALNLAPEVLAAVPPGALPSLVAPITEAGTPGVGAPGNDEVLPSAVALTNDAGSRVVDAPKNNQDQDANTGKKGKGKHGKKGKKGGKRRR